MKTPNIMYDVCRHYIHDYRDAFDLVSYHRILGWIRARDFRSLASASSLIPGAYQSRKLNQHTRQIEAFFKKNALFTDKVVATENALSTFSKAERICQDTNLRLDRYSLDHNLVDSDIQVWLSRMEHIIHRTLGPVERFIEDIPHLIRVTSGATATLSRRNATPYLKLSKRVSSTPRAAPYLDALSRFFGYGSMRPRVQLANRVTTVPKSWKTDRTIACEPTGNIPLQLAGDTYIKTRLKRKLGIDLSSQERNQELARIGSIDGRFATIDLSMASDTLSLNTVALLLPSEWFRVLDDFRSPAYVDALSGQTEFYHKFSSMGNGTTFTIETLVFAAAVVAVGSKDYSVYGDDIIIETELAQDLVRLLQFLGFSINEDKSFLAGSFRESCGADWFDGTNVTPFYVRAWTDQKTLLCHNINGLAKVGLPDGHLWELLANIVRENNLPLVPPNGDSRSGIMIDAGSCYDRGLICYKTKTRKGTWVASWIPKFRGFQPIEVKLRKTKYADLRHLYLWYLEKFRYGGSAEAYESSLVPTISHKYVRKWVRWLPITAPMHLFAWEQFLRERDL